MTDPRFSGLGALMSVSRPPAGGGGGAGAGFGDAPPAPPPTLQVFPWWYYPPPASQYVYVDSLAATGAAQVVVAGGQDVVVAGTQFAVVDGQRAVITGIAIGVQTPLPTDNYFFTLKRNNGPIEGVRALRNFPVAANASVREFGGFAIKFEPRDSIEWTVTNNGANPVTIFLSYQGWIASVNEIERIQQGNNY